MSRFLETSLLLAALALGAAPAARAQASAGLRGVDPTKKRVLAWAYGLDPAETVAALRKLPGVGAVLYPATYEVALRLPGRPYLAYVGSVTAAHELVRVVGRGGRFLAAIVLDERNATGPSGPYLTPAEYAARYLPIRAVLRAGGVPVSVMGLMAVGGWLRQLFWSLRFDDGYFRRLIPGPGAAQPTQAIPAEYYAFNPNKVRPGELLRVLRTYAFARKPWILSPAPFNRWWEALCQPIGAGAWVRLSQDPRVLCVALWSLVEAPGQVGLFGLLDRRGRLTRTGRAVLAALR